MVQYIHCTRSSPLLQAQSNSIQPDLMLVVKRAIARSFRPALQRWQRARIAALGQDSMRIARCSAGDTPAPRASYQRTDARTRKEWRRWGRIETFDCQA